MGVKRSLLVVDMPKGSYSSKKSALKNARSISKNTGCDAIKIESNNKNFSIIKIFSKEKNSNNGHIGFTPQFKKKFKVEGQNKKQTNKLLKEAKLIESAGAFSIVLECLSPKSAKLITED